VRGGEIKAEPRAAPRRSAPLVNGSELLVGSLRRAPQPDKRQVHLPVGPLEFDVEPGAGDCARVPLLHVELTD